MKNEFDIKEYVKNLKGTTYFHTFVNRDNLAAGVLRLLPGDEDTQEPHDSDEIYYVVKGDGFLQIGQKNYAVSEGKAYFVGRNIKHKFFGNSKELVVLYFFGGPDS